MRWLPVLLVVFVAGCTTPVRVRHPDGRVAQCGPLYRPSLYALTLPEREARCVGDYERQGFQRVAD